VLLPNNHFQQIIEFRITLKKLTCLSTVVSALICFAVTAPALAQQSVEAQQLAETPTQDSVSAVDQYAVPSAQQYSAGMTAYMDGDFEQAQINWLNAARANDGRAMFNLGLLHERQKLAEANDSTAEQWFLQAGKAGYAPADYHLALRLLGRNQNVEAERLLRRAADAGFILAQERLGLSQVAKKSQTQTQSTQTSRNQSGVNVSTEQARAYNREPWVLKQSSEAWTIQLLAFRDEAKVRNFIDDHALHRNAAYFTEGSGGAVIYKLIYGAYPTKQQADEARAGFTSALKEHGPWLRPLKAVQGVIKQG